MGDGSCRWFPAEAVEAPEAQYLDIILYSRDQLMEEHKALPGRGSADSLPEVPWGIISIKAQDEDHETPMQVPLSGQYQPSLLAAHTTSLHDAVRMPCQHLSQCLQVIVPNLHVRCSLQGPVAESSLLIAPSVIGCCCAAHHNHAELTGDQRGG